MSVFCCCSLGKLLLGLLPFSLKLLLPRQAVIGIRVTVMGRAGLGRLRALQAKVTGARRSVSVYLLSNEACSAAVDRSMCCRLITINLVTRRAASNHGGAGSAIASLVLSRLVEHLPA